MPKPTVFKGHYYTTSFCNFAHRLKDGMPVNHECYVLNPRGLAAEIAGDYTFRPFRTNRTSKGIRVTFKEAPHA